MLSSLCFTIVSLLCQQVAELQYFIFFPFSIGYYRFDGTRLVASFNSQLAEK